MGMIEDIIDWAQTLSSWQADAVRRLLGRDELTRSDKEELLRMLKSEYSLPVAEGDLVQPEPPRRGSFSGVPADQIELALHAIEAIQNANAIPNGSRLPFGVAGLTVIYGENASGKSGYARIIKHACKARDTEERILPNVLASQVINAPASANILVSINNSEPTVLRWIDGVRPPEVLTNVAFFDSRCARIIVDDECALSYLPYGADVFRRLGDLMNEFKSHLQVEAVSPTAIQVQGITADSTGGKLLTTLSASTPNEDIEATCTWSDPDGDRLKELQYLLDNDPSRLAGQLEIKIRRIEQLKEGLEGLDRLIANSAASEMNRLVEELSVAEGALKIAASSMTSEPLPGVGSDVWRLLYEAAREYSTKIAYPTTPFPYVKAGARCVWCMQSLAPDAVDRLGRFRRFMEDKTALVAEAARGKIAEKRKTLFATLTLKADQFADALETLATEEPGLLPSILTYFSEASSRLSALKVAVFPMDVNLLPSLASPPIQEIVDVGRRISEKAASFRRRSQPEEQIKIKKERDELQSRKILAARKGDLTSYVQKLKTKAAYDRCLASLNTRSISDTGKRLIAGAMTPGFVESMKGELDKLGAGYLDITPTPVAQAGETYHRLVLAGMQRSTRADLSEILSEGEQCVVAIAGFLAELSASGHKGPVVFDDPVCSLDHRYRDLIAKRLAEEAVIRQVMIFTHDISLLLELRHWVAANQRIAWAPFTVAKVGKSPGKVTRGEPREALNLSQQLVELRTEVDAIAALARTEMTEYNKLAAAIYDRLRGAIDTFVERELLNRAVMRHTNRVSIDALDNVDCEDADCTELQSVYDLCGRNGAAHGNAAPLDVNRPLPAAIKADIERVQNYATRVKIRRKGLRDHRKELREPKAGRTG